MVFAISFQGCGSQRRWGEKEDPVSRGSKVDRGRGGTEQGTYIERSEIILSSQIPAGKRKSKEGSKDGSVRSWPWRSTPWREGRLLSSGWDPLPGIADAAGERMMSYMYVLRFLIRVTKKLMYDACGEYVNDKWFHRASFMRQVRNIYKKKSLAGAKPTVIKYSWISFRNHK